MSMSLVYHCRFHRPSKTSVKFYCKFDDSAGRNSAPLALGMEAVEFFYKSLNYQNYSCFILIILLSANPKKYDYIANNFSITI